MQLKHVESQAMFSMQKEKKTAKIKMSKLSTMFD